MMDDFGSFIASLGDLSILPDWRSISALYDEIDRYAGEFTRTFKVRCPPGCGTCCEHFLPDITDLEASFIAAYLLFRKMDIPSVVDEDRRLCPFYVKDDPFHCLVYPVRATVCRMFASVPSKDKHGQPVFRRCRYNTLEDQLQTIGPESFMMGGKEVRTMGDFSAELAVIAKDMARYDIDIAVTRQLIHLKQILSYISGRWPFDPLAS